MDLDSVSSSASEALEAKELKEPDFRKNEEASEKKKTRISTRRMKKIPKITAEMIFGENGIAKVMEIYKTSAIKDLTSTNNKLDTILGLQSSWISRICPEIAFPDAMSDLEALSRTKPVRDYITRNRRNYTKNGTFEGVKGNFEDLDDILSKIDENESSKTNGEETEISKINKESLETAKNEKIGPKIAVKSAEISFGKVSLTESQKERIKANRERALKLKEERRKAKESLKKEN